MSEEEIIEKYHHFKIKTADGIELDLIETKYYKELLVLYEQEKEKNKELLLEIDKINEDKELYKLTGQNTFVNSFMNNNYISKDKIKEKIDELIRKERTSKLEMGNLYRYGIAVLNSVLEEK